MGFFGAFASGFRREGIAEAGKVVAALFRTPVSDRAGRLENLEMAPQRFEKIEFAPENGMVPKTRTP